MNNRVEEVIEILLIEESSEYVQLLGETLNPPGPHRFTIIHADRLSTGLEYLAKRNFMSSDHLKTPARKLRSL